jgi:hypothetical protein
MKVSNNYINKLVDDIDNTLNDTIVIKKMPIEIFKYFIPYFKGEKKSDYIIVKWIELAGSPFLPVKLIDEEGNIVDEVPPLYANKVKEKTDTKFSILIDKVKTNNRLMQGKGDAILKKTLQKEIEHLNITTEKWLELLNKYDDNKIEVKTEKVDEIKDDGFDIEF